MPHVLIAGPCSVRRYWDEFASREWRDGDLVVRTVSAFLARGETAVLVECAVAEGFLRQVFLVHLSQKDEGVLARLFHATSPERTVGVRRCLAWIGEEPLAQDPSCWWGSHTLGVPLPSH